MRAIVSTSARPRSNLRRSATSGARKWTDAGSFRCGAAFWMSFRSRRRPRYALSSGTMKSIPCAASTRRVSVPPRAWRAYTFTLRGKNCSAAATPFCAIFPGTSHSSYSMNRRVFSSVRARWSGNISRAPKAGPRAKRQRRPLSRPPSFGKTFRAVRPSAWRASTAAFRSSRYARNFQLRRRPLRASRVTLNS